MKAVIQRVSEASVSIGGNLKSEINTGLLVLVGIEDADNDDDVEWLSGKVARIRLFDDENGVMNKSVNDVGGGIIVVSQFTLHASTKKGNRPSYIKASKPDHAVPVYEKFVEKLQGLIDAEVQTGEFGADMKVSLLNDGPVTIIIDSKNKE